MSHVQSKSKRYFFPLSHNWVDDWDKALTNTAWGDISFLFLYFFSPSNWGIHWLSSLTCPFLYLDSKNFDDPNPVGTLWSRRPCLDHLCFSSHTWHSALYKESSQKSLITLLLKFNSMERLVHKKKKLKMCWMIEPNSMYKEHLETTSASDCRLLRLL